MIMRQKGPVRRSKMQDGSLQAGRSTIRVAHLSSVHPPYDNRIFWKECAALVEAGYDVCLIAPMKHPGRGRASNGVEIIGVKQRSGRMARMMLSTLAVAAAAVRQNAAVYHFHDPELLPAGFALRLIGKRLVYDVHEDYPLDILSKDWIPSRLRVVVARAATAVEWIAARVLSGIVVASPIVADRFPPNRVALVQNFVRTADFANVARPPLAGRRAVAYVGAITKERCAFEMVQAIGRLEKHPNVQLILAGEMDTPLLAHALAETPGWRRVDYRGHQDRAGVQRALSEARAGLVVLYPTAGYIESQPTKLYEYMAAGIPVIASDFPRFRELVEGNGCGLCVPSRDVAAITAAIEWIFNHPAEAELMGKRGQELVRRHFCWEQEAETLLRFYDRILGR
jgi:glycosyltransferase involved in cell wall biosynthesis